MIKKITVNYKKLHKKITQNLHKIFYRVCISYHIIHRLTQFPFSSYFSRKYPYPARSALASVDILKEKMKAIMAEISSQKKFLYLNLQFCAKNYMYS